MRARPAIRWRSSPGTRASTMRAAGARRRRRLALALALLAASLIALAACSLPAAIAQVPPQGTFAISPARRVLAGRPPVTLVPTRVSNTTREGYTVRVFAVLLHQNLTGAFQFDERPRPLNAARTILHVSPSRFRLAAGQSREIGLRWQLLPLGARSAYIGVVFQGQARRKGTSVPVISRLLSINFLRLPGRYHPKGAFTALHAIQFAPRVLRILPRVRNTGDIVDTPRHGRLAIEDSTGQTVYKTRWTGDVILPGAEREFPIDVHHILPAGSYTAHAAMSFGARRHARISTPFTLVGPNELPTPSFKINAFAAHGQIGHFAHVSGQVQSTGTAPVNLDLHLSLFRDTAGLPGSTPLATRQLHFATLAPGSTRSLDLELTKGLTSGEYHVLARYTDPSGVVQQLTSDFAATHHRGFLDRLKLFFDQHTLLIVLIIALIALIALGVLLFRQRRRQRRLESELRQVKTQLDHDRLPTP